MLGMPFTNTRWGFVIVLVISLVVTVFVAWWLTRSKFFK
jgi:magnesium transporter